MFRRGAAMRALGLGMMLGVVVAPALADDPPGQVQPKPTGTRPVRPSQRNPRRVDASRPAQSADEKGRRANPPEFSYPSPDSIKPTPLTPIPDSPPPHEGALFDLPIVIEPPDMVIVEVLEALPGRPISGERLVRPDGMISLGFYGDVHVKGLTLSQAKEKIVLHLVRVLPDEVLGLCELGLGDIEWTKIAPRDASRVFVDVTAHNSQQYYIQGDVATPGKHPFTGNDTVLDAINYAGGLLASADRTAIRLCRPARGGKPSQEFRVDLEAIQKGDPVKNLQLFPGDRLIIGRDANVAATIQQDREAASLHAMLNTVRQVALMSSELVKATPDLSGKEREKLVGEWVSVWSSGALPLNGRDSSTVMFSELMMKTLRLVAPKNSGPRNLPVAPPR